VKTVSFDELPPYPVRSFTYRNEQVRADELYRVIMYIGIDGDFVENEFELCKERSHDLI
jgi:hypothetical protein